MAERPLRGDKLIFDVTCRFAMLRLTAERIGLRRRTVSSRARLGQNGSELFPVKAFFFSQIIPMHNQQQVNVLLDSTAENDINRLHRLYLLLQGITTGGSSL